MTFAKVRIMGSFKAPNCLPALNLVRSKSFIQALNRQFLVGVVWRMCFITIDIFHLLIIVLLKLLVSKE